jgi:hypothetical protein
LIFVGIANLQFGEKQGCHSGGEGVISSPYDTHYIHIDQCFFAALVAFGRPVLKPEKTPKVCQFIGGSIAE